jgi:hypothetical protein
MHDDEAMDRLLRDTMAADVPQLSPSFDGRVMRRARPRRLTRTGRAVVAVYVVLAAATGVWLMRDLPMVSILAAIMINVAVAAGAGAYARRLVVGR